MTILSQVTIAEPVAAPELAISYFIGSGITAVAGIVAFVCMVMVLIKLFQKEGPGLGILGVFCGIYTFIWGWMKHKEQGLKKVMIIWSVMFVVVGIGYAIMFAGIISAGAMNSPEFDTAPPIGIPEQEITPDL